MIANFLDYFYTDSYDSKIIINDLTVKEVKKLVLDRINNLSNLTIPSKLCCFEFMIEILARIFVEKDIYLDKANTSGAVKLTEFPQIESKNIFIRFKTSGSSGKEKTITKTLQNLFYESEELKSTFPKIKELRFISTTTPKHLFGFVFHFMLPLNSGMVINTDEITIPEDISIENSCLITTPSFLEKMQKYDNKPVVNPNYIFSAGAALKSEVFGFARTIADNVVDIYGSTETGIIAHREHENNNFKLFNNIKISPNKSSTTIETAFSFVSPVQINDKLTLLENGSIKIEGRTDRTFKIQEKRIDANDLENLLNEHNFIQNCYITKHGEKLACLAVLNNTGLEYFYNNGFVNLTKMFKSELRKHSEIIPQIWKFLDEIPTTSAGKVDKQEIENILGLNLSIPLIIKKDINTNFAKIKLYFYKNCNFFQGHFDGFPIVAGVVQLFLAQYFAQKLFKIKPSGQYRKIKFSNIIKPEKFIDLELELLSNNISYKFVDRETKYSSGTIARK